MKYNVLLLPEAENDLIDIYTYVVENDSVSHAERLLEIIENKCDSLSANPERGHYVPELKRVHVATFREIHFKPYRIIYQVVVNDVFIHAVLDGRRELQELLEMRILR